MVGCEHDRLGSLRAGVRSGDEGGYCFGTSNAKRFEMMVPFQCGIRLIPVRSLLRSSKACETSLATSSEGLLEVQVRRESVRISHIQDYAATR
jgi:hypothetical protein